MFRKRQIKKLKRVILWLWVITTPVVIVGSYTTYSAVSRFLTYQVRYSPKPGEMPLSMYVDYEWRRLTLRAQSYYLHYFNKPSSLKKINIVVKKQEMALLESHMPQSGFEFIKGKIKIGDKLEKAKIKYRGDFIYHWGFDKKSTRVKTSKNYLFEGIREFNLQAPKFTSQLNNYLSYKLAKDLKLITPKTELTRLEFNGTNRGIHIFVEQISELTLRHRKNMPGDIYRGEIVGKDNFTNSGIANLFYSKDVWDKMAVNNHYYEGSMAPLKVFLDLILEKNSRDSAINISSFLDLEAWGRFSAFEALSQTRHYDYSHNWRLYYDPWKQKIIPIVWDPAG